MDSSAFEKLSYGVYFIEYNETEDGIYHRSYPNQREEFINYLKNCNMVVNVRQSKGQDIAAACGQLVKQGQEATK